MADEELQEPESPEGKKKKKKPEKQPGSIPLPLAIGVIVGVLIVGAMINFVLMKFVINDAPADSTATKQNEMVHSEEESLLTPEDSLDLAIKMWKDKSERKTFVTDRITTNPRGSKSIVVLSLAVEYFMDKEKLLKFMEEEALGEEGQYMQGIKTFTKTTTISLIGEKSEDYLLNHRDSLSADLKDKLVPYYDEKSIFLIDIKFTEYIIQ